MGTNSIAKKVRQPLGTINSWIARSGLQGKGGRNIKMQQKSVQSVQLYNEGKNIWEIMNLVGSSFYQIKDWIAEAGFDIDRIAFKQCANLDCNEVVTNPAKKYHSDECRAACTTGRPKNPEKWENLICPNFEDPQCRCFNVKDIKTPIPYPRRKRKALENKYCSNHCSNRMREYEVLNIDGVKTTGYELQIVGDCKFLKVPVERVDRKNSIRFQGSDGRMKEYAPDYLVAGKIWIEAKGLEDEDDRERVRAWRKQKGGLTAIIRRDNLFELRGMKTATQYYEYLKKIALEQEKEDKSQM